MRVAIVGAGLQCRRRAPVVAAWPGAELVVIASHHLSSASAQAKRWGCETSDRWQDVVARPDIDVVLVCTPPDSHAEISIASANAGKHILCEKPLSRTVAEGEAMLAAAGSNGVVLKCGFNHRHHPAVWKANELIASGALGAPLWGRCVYGIGGRPGYEKEWRADPDIVAGGHVMEQGIHGVDLFRWFLGDVVEVTGFTSTSYWPITPLEDNGFILLRTEGGAIASLHSSLTQWRNLFVFEIYATEGYVRVEGLGGGYGNERLAVGKKDFFAPFSEDVTEFRGDDVSWVEEWKEFLAAIEDKRKPIGDGRDGVEALRIVHAFYESARTGCTVQVAR
jgi:predicted dehydrogenase